MLAANAHELAQQPPPADEYQRRTKVDGDELEAVARGRADRAVESPGSTVNRDRQREDNRRLDPARVPLTRAAIDVERDGEQ